MRLNGDECVGKAEVKKLNNVWLVTIQQEQTVSRM